MSIQGMLVFPTSAKLLACFGRAEGGNMQQKNFNTAASLDAAEINLIHRYWCAANYLSVGQIYLLDNPPCANRCSPSISSRACSATGAQRRG